jgi:hypothetical protein
MKIRGVIKPDGTLVAVYSDFIRDLNLGPLQVDRASDIEFNAQAQLWEARWPDGTLIVCHPKRDFCLEVEKRAVEDKILSECQINH